MTDIVVIILVGQEKLHIRRCLEKLQALEPKQVFVVESQPSDGTHEIAVEMGATTVFHKWPGNQALQFNWAIDNLSIDATWILRIDADEWLTDELIAEIKKKIPLLDGDITGCILKRRHYFLGKWVKWGVYPTRILRVFRTGRARYASDMLMDEHLETDGKIIEFDCDFVDDSIAPLEEWKDKHRDYARREALMAIAGKVNKNKRHYYKFPPYFRAVAYFCYRYFWRLGFLDGIAGWRWHFWQGLWYRWLVDCEISRMRRDSAMSFPDSVVWVMFQTWRFATERFRRHPPAAKRSEDGKTVVFHVVKTLAPEYGGPARSVQGLVSALDAAGVEAHLVAIEECDDPWGEGVSRYHCLKARGHKDVYRKMCALVDEFKPDIIHTHDCWMPILNMCHLAARDKGVKYVISPRGSLKTWSRRQKWLKKWIALKTYEGYDLSHAAALHVTAEDEREQVAELGTNKNIIQVTNGLMFPKDVEVEAIVKALRSRKKNRALFLSRIHYTKGLVNLVEAWAKVRPAGWELEIVGTDADGYQAVVEEKVKALGIGDSVIFSGPASEKAKWGKYLGADLFVHPTFTENFGIVIAEALYAGLPVITTKGAPWEDLEKEGCGWWIDIGVDPLAAALRKALATSKDELEQMGIKGHELVVRKYSWSALGWKMKKEYERILGGS